MKEIIMSMRYKKNRNGKNHNLPQNCLYGKGLFGSQKHFNSVDLMVMFKFFVHFIEDR